MIRPDPQTIKGLAQAVRQHPEILAWMENVFAHEIKRLPWAVDNPTVFQGRCQMLMELMEVLKEAPAVAAKL